MRNLLYIFTIATIISCTSEDDTSQLTPEDNFNFSAFKFQGYDSLDFDTLSITYNLNDAVKIADYSRDSIEGFFTYNPNDLLATVERVVAGEINDKVNYKYDDHNLTEILLEDRSSSEIVYSKIEYTHSDSDTIYVSRKNSNDGTIYDINITDCKIVLDENDNRTYFERYLYSDDRTRAIVSEYDNNNNLVTETFYDVLGSQLIERFNNRVSFLTSKSSLYEIFQRTYTRKNLMLTNHLNIRAINQNTSGINRINARNISPNNISTFQTDFNTSVNIEIINQADSLGYSTNTIIKTYFDNTLFTVFEYTFIK